MSKQISDGLSIKNEPKMDYYERLEVDKNANEIDITKSYKKLALKYHPDRNLGNEEAANMFKEISEAYTVLSDPNKRRQYDLSFGSTDIANQIESVDMASVGQIGRVFGALAGKMGIPIPTSISQETLTKAQEICQTPPFLTENNPNLLPLRLGVSYSGSVNRQQGLFFLIRISREVSELGLALKCSSSNKSRFKLVVFDQKGGVRYQEESSKSSSEKYTICTLFFTPFEVGYLNERIDVANMEESLPPIFSRLTTFQVIQRRLEPGDHLVCVYGDNFLNAAKISLTAIAVSQATQMLQSSIKNIDSEVINKRQVIREFQDEYLAARKVWDEIQQRLALHADDINRMIHEREVTYDEFLKLSLQNCVPAEPRERSVDISREMRSREMGRQRAVRSECEGRSAGLAAVPGNEDNWARLGKSFSSLFKTN